MDKVPLNLVSSLISRLTLFSSVDGYLFTYFNPLSPNSDQHQFSPDNIHMLSREMVTRVNQIITKEKMVWSFIKLSQLISKEVYEYQCGEFVCGYWGLKGYQNL